MRTTTTTFMTTTVARQQNSKDDICVLALFVSKSAGGLDL